MMDKPARSKNKFLMFLPKPASANIFQNHTFSPTKDKRSEFNQTKLKTHIGKGFSGPIISIIPADARRNTKNSSFEAQQEPTSPKVSCIGQIKHKKKVIKNEKHASPPKDFKPVQPKKKVSKIRSLFSSKTPTGRRSDDSDGKSELSDKAPSLSQTRRFSNGRDSLSSFDWMAQVAPVDGDSDEESEEEEEREIIIPFSAPILVGGVGGGVVALEPRKEINLWKRRTMAQPRPLQVDEEKYENGGDWRRSNEHCFENGGGWRRSDDMAKVNACMEDDVAKLNEVANWNKDTLPSIIAAKDGKESWVSKIIVGATDSGFEK
ncbi:Uncharacterized protein LOK49_LG08G00181 [Camellia lanceoleosa]|uniref:Uncharacterized protein n=1 Tax=Camellia lanceoleosa TaxID=1840588 RepID=A0ACC0GWQ4_9ERIC|nr:Uncharacterized protein LOK49_LG08G00181 [Camellia lanceoleosa]